MFPSRFSLLASFLSSGFLNLFKFFFVTVTLFACSHNMVSQIESPVERELVSRNGILNLDKGLDRKKILSQGDFVGWMKLLDGWVGQYGKSHVGFFNLTGRVIWSRFIQDSVSAPMLELEDSIIYALRNGDVFSVSKSDGSVLWQQNIGVMVLRKMKKTGDSILAVTAEDKLFSLNANSGAVEWFYGDKKRVGLAIRQVSAPQVVRDVVVYGVRDGSVHGVDKSSGNLRWVYRPEQPTFAESAFADVVGEVAIVGKSAIFARADGLIDSFSLDERGDLEKSNGSSVKVPIELTAINTATTAVDVFYVGTESGDVVALHAGRGEVLWRKSLGSPVSMLHGVESMVIASTLDGHLLALSARDGSLTWFDMLESSVLMQPIFEDGRLYVSAGSRVIYSYEFNSLRKHFE